MTMLELAQQIADLSGGKSDVTFVQPEDQRTKDDPKRRKPDVTRARTILKWEPKVDLNTGLKKTIDYFQKRLTT
jgi:nucleoside-diphosphate-sugar epimerase